MMNETLFFSRVQNHRQEEILEDEEINWFEDNFLEKHRVKRFCEINAQKQGT